MLGFATRLWRTFLKAACMEYNITANKDFYNTFYVLSYLTNLQTNKMVQLFFVRHGKKHASVSPPIHPQERSSIQEKGVQRKLPKESSNAHTFVSRSSATNSSAFQVQRVAHQYADLRPGPTAHNSSL